MKQWWQSDVAHHGVDRSRGGHLHRHRHLGHAGHARMGGTVLLRHHAVGGDIEHGERRVSELRVWSGSEIADALFERGSARLEHIRHADQRNQHHQHRRVSKSSHGGNILFPHCHTCAAGVSRHVLCTSALRKFPPLLCLFNFN